MAKTRSPEDYPAAARSAPVEPDLDRVARAFLNWFRRRQRPLPWRGNPSAYAVWVSEIMLQQTQVATVVPFFERFMERFPTIETLAAAEEEEVLRLWAGLGYYSRARNLHRGAREVVDRLGGRVPSDLSELLALKGIGPYTAGAIASIAFNVSAPLLDGNVMRVLCRLFALPGDPKRGPLNRKLWDLARRLIPDGEAREFNPAMMELGAIVCTPRAPRCGECPVSADCRAFRSGEQDRYPETAPRRAPESVQMVCGVVVRADARVLLIRPASEGRWGGLWQLPSATLDPADGFIERLIVTLHEMGLSTGSPTPLVEIRHGITRFSITLNAFECRLAAEGDPSVAFPFRWADPDELRASPMPAPHRRIVRAWLSGIRAGMPPGRQLPLDLGEPAGP